MQSVRSRSQVGAMGLRKLATEALSAPSLLVANLLIINILSFKNLALHSDIIT